MRKFGLTIKSKKAECVSLLPTPQPLGLLEQPAIADGGSRISGCLAGPYQYGQGDVKSKGGEPKEMYSVESDKRVSNMRH